MDDRVRIICEMVADGHTLREIATMFGLSPGTIYGYTQSTPEAAEQYARAREAASDLFESEIIEAARGTNPFLASADRVTIDALKWVAARRAPKKYGDKSAVDVTSGDKPLAPTIDPVVQREALSALIGKLID